MIWKRTTVFCLLYIYIYIYIYTLYNIKQYYLHVQITEKSVDVTSKKRLVCLQKPLGWMFSYLMQWNSFDIFSTPS